MCRAKRFRLMLQRGWKSMEIDWIHAFKFGTMLSMLVGGVLGTLVLLFLIASAAIGIVAVAPVVVVLLAVLLVAAVLAVSSAYIWFVGAV